MRIAYVGQMADVSTENGISKKIRMQAAHWMQAGHEVRYFSLAGRGTVWSGLAPLEADVLPQGGAALRVLRSLRLVRRIRAWRPDVIYFRYAYHSPGLPALFREIPTVAEINSDDVREYPLTLSRGKVWYHRATRARLLRTVSAFVAVTRELADRFREFARPIEVIGNSIQLADFAPAPLPPRDAPPRFIFVGSPGTPWHGVDRLAELARLRPDAGFDIVGYGPDDWAAAFPAPAAFRFHGHLPRSTYEPLLHAATVAVGPLAMYRKSMDEACPLKIREYLAAGVPVIAGHADTDIPEGADYFLRLPNSPAPLDDAGARLDAFLHHWRDRRVPRAAIAHLDATVKEQQRLAFVATVARRPRR